MSGDAHEKPSESAIRNHAEDSSESSVQSAADLITEQLGLEKVRNFSARKLFSEVFSRHEQNELENLFTVGSVATTPSLDATMGRMPTPWVFFRSLVAALIVYFIFQVAWSQFENPFVLPGLIMVGSFAVPISVLVLFLELNTPRNVSILRVIQLVMLGGAVSILISLILFEITPLLGVLGAPAAGFIEETGKLLTVLLMTQALPMERYPYRLNALLFGASVGVGFAAFESAGYALVIGISGSSEEMISNITLRGLMSPFGHIVWTAIAFSAYWMARKIHAGTWDALKSRRFLQVFAVPVALHFIWNISIDGPFLMKYWVLGFVAWVIVISLVQSGLREIAEQSSRSLRAANAEGNVT